MFCCIVVVRIGSRFVLVFCCGVDSLTCLFGVYLLCG